jgi:hypothetical protein
VGVKELSEGLVGSVVVFGEVDAMDGLVKLPAVGQLRRSDEDLSSRVRASGSSRSARRSRR